MRYVLDSSVAFKTLVAEQDSDKAIRLLDDFRNGILELISPDILPIEVAHESLLFPRLAVQKNLERRVFDAAPSS